MKRLIALSLTLFSTSLFAAAQPAAAEPSPFGPVIVIGGMMLLMYFIVWRPQQKKAKQQTELVSSVKVGDEVMMSSGIIGRVTKQLEQYMEVEVAQGVQLLVQKTMVSAVLPKGSMKSVRGSE